MDARGCVLVAIVLINCVCMSFVSASQETDSFPEAYSQLRGKNMLEKRLREDITRELNDVKVLEEQLMKHLNLITEKKRQLEIKKRQPIQCLVNNVACWKRK